MKNLFTLSLLYFLTAIFPCWHFEKNGSFFLAFFCGGGDSSMGGGNIEISLL